MQNIVANEVIIRFLLNKDKVIVICDDAYISIAQKIQLIKPNTEIIKISSKSDSDLAFQKSITKKDFTIVFIEPNTFCRFSIPQWLNFNLGEPEILGVNSKVFVFPFDSFCRIFSESMTRSKEIQQSLLDSLKDNCTYRITTSTGTDLIFTSRKGSSPKCVLDSH